MVDPTPNPQGQSGDAGAAAAAAEPVEPEKRYTEEEHQAAIKARVKNLRGENERLKAELAKQAQVQRPDDDEAEDAPPAQAATPTGTAQPDPAAVWRKKLEAERKAKAALEAEWKGKLDAAEKAHRTTRIQHELARALASRKDITDAEAVIELVGPHLDVNDAGQTVAKDADGDEIPLPAYLETWFRKHPVFVSAAPGGAGSGPGAAVPGRKKPGEMTEHEAYRAGIEALHRRAGTAG